MTDIDGALLDDLADILRGRPRSQAITSSQLSDRLGLSDGEASPKTREAIRVLRRERGLPVRAGNVGYWVCQSEQEAEEYLDDLLGRIDGIRQTMAEFAEAWEQYHGDAVPPQVRDEIEADPVLTVEDWREHRASAGGDGT